MNNLKLREATRKLIKPCATCGGSGINNFKDTVNSITRKGFEYCNTCKGKGYIDELEFGVEVEDESGGIITFLQKIGNTVFTYCCGTLTSHHIRLFEDEYKNLGKELRLEELLLASEIKQGGKDINHLIDILVAYDFKLKPEQQSEEVINKLIEILS